MNSNVESHTEVLGHEGTESVSLKDHLSLEERTLWHSRVLLLGLDHHDRLVLEEVIDEQLVNPEVFKAALDNRLFEVTVKSEHLNKSSNFRFPYLFIQLDKGRLELFVDVAADVVRELCVRKTLARFGLLFSEVLHWWSGHCVERNLNVVTVSILLKFHVANFLVRNDGWVVCGDIAGEFGEVRCHFLKFNLKKCDYLEILDDSTYLKSLIYNY